MENKGSNLVIGLRPQMAKLPLPIQRHDDPFLPLSRAVIDAAHPYVVGVMFDLAAYLALGAAGAVALERAIAYAGSRGDLLSILHAPFATADYAAATSALAFAPDGVTIVNSSLIPSYVLRHQAGAFVVGRVGDSQEYSVFDVTARELSVSWQGERQTLQVVGDEVVYADMGDDFALAIAGALAARRGAWR
jgi:hypothetical protein